VSLSTEIPPLNVIAGDGSAAAALGTRYYWGSHGLEQSHANALHWYHAARRKHNIAGLVGAAKMLLKGEGGDKDVSMALVYMNEARAHQRHSERHSER
jgi:TPR repeat protein